MRSHPRSKKHQKKVKVDDRYRLSFFSHNSRAKDYEVIEENLPGIGPIGYAIDFLV